MKTRSALVHLLGLGAAGYMAYEAQKHLRASSDANNAAAGIKQAAPTVDTTSLTTTADDERSAGVAFAVGAAALLGLTALTWRRT